MNWLDVVFLMLIVVGTAYGAWKGFIMLAAMVLAVTVGITAAGHLGGPVADLLMRYFANEVACGLAGFVIIFIAVAAAIVIGAVVIRKALYRIKLGGADRLVGSLVGALAGFLLSTAILLACVNASSRKMVAPVQSSAIAPVLARTANMVRVWISERISRRLGRYLDEQEIDLDDFEIKMPEA